MNDKWRIWFQSFDIDGTPTGAGVMLKEYTRKGNAVRAAKKHFNGVSSHKWIVSKENPFGKDKVEVTT